LVEDISKNTLLTFDILIIIKKKKKKKKKLEILVLGVPSKFPSFMLLSM
jgi:hypothetical protein